MLEARTRRGEGTQDLLVGDRRVVNDEAFEVRAAKDEDGNHGGLHGKIAVHLKAADRLWVGKGGENRIVRDEPVEKNGLWGRDSVEHGRQTWVESHAGTIHELDNLDVGAVEGEVLVEEAEALHPGIAGIEILEVESDFMQGSHGSNDVNEALGVAIKLLFEVFDVGEEVVDADVNTVHERGGVDAAVTGSLQHSLQVS